MNGTKSTLIDFYREIILQKIFSSISRNLTRKKYKKYKIQLDSYPLIDLSSYKLQRNLYACS